MDAPAMPNLSIKNAPERIVKKLKERAQRNHRSLQGELLSILEKAADEPRPLSPKEVLAEARRRGVRTPAEAAAIIRADRDGR
jgi:antitoxin FitA